MPVVFWKTVPGRKLELLRIGIRNNSTFRTEGWNGTFCSARAKRARKQALVSGRYYTFSIGTRLPVYTISFPKLTGNTLNVFDGNCSIVFSVYKLYYIDRILLVFS